LSIKKNQLKEEHINFRDSFLPPLYFTICLWLIHFFQIWTNLDLGYWGIYPRESIGMRGIIFAPLLHGDWEHLASNSLPFLVLGTMIIYFYPRVALRVTLIIYFLSGILVWLFARSGVFHIGLSYVVYGLVAFVFWTGVFRRSIRSIVLALLVTTFYSGMIAGILPTTEVLQKNISWESHLIGGFVGIFVAYFFKEEMEEDEKEVHHYADEEQNFYFERDVFDKTIEQRHLEQLEQERLRQLEIEERRQQQFPYSNGWFSNDTFS
jgi:membrane associated rhomboid family serine protease